MDSNQASPGPAGPDRQFWLPDVPPRVRFIGIGAQKCASTWLHDVLAQHPEVSLPEQKEIDFFSYHFDFGYQWYERHFAAGDSALMTGEISPSYLHGPGVPERVARYNPEMRVILIVRDPIARAYSNHKHEVRIGHLHGEDLSFEAGLRNNPSYVEQGLYGRHLKRWLTVFSREHVQVVRFEDVVYDPAGVLQSVCEFLRIGPMPAGARLSDRSNESYLVRHDSFEAVKNVLRSTVRAVGLGGAWQRLGDSGLRARYRRLNRVAPESSIGAPAPDTIAALRTLFQADVEEFSRLTGLSLDDWLKQ